MSLQEEMESNAIAYYDGLTVDQQRSMVRSLMANLENMDALDIASDFILCPEPEPLTDIEIAKLITFENANKVARELVFSDLIAAKALYEELKWWNKTPHLGLVELP